jgi:hypothetical protein
MQQENETQEVKVDRRRGPRAGVRTSRNQETREAAGVHDMPIDFEPTGPLPDIPARPGYAQRWIRVKKGKENDAQNLFAAQRRGWAPRSPNTVPKSMQWLCSQREGIGDCIGTPDMVLMERPNELNAREVEAKRRGRRAIEQAVKSNLFSEYKQMGGSATGFTAPADESSSQVERGRRPAIQDD